MKDNIEFTGITIEQTIMLSKKQLTKGDFIVEYLDTVSKLSKKEIRELSLNQALNYMLQFLYENFNNPEIAEGITVLDLYSDEDTKSEDKPSIIKIDGYSFKTDITVENLISAERLCYLKGHHQLLGLYCLASTCLKGIETGVQTLLKAKDSNSIRSSIITLDEYISKNYDLNISFLLDTEHITVGKESSVIWKNDFFFFV